MTDNELIAEWAGWTRDKTVYHSNLWIAPKHGCWSGAPPFTSDITLWHGDGGLLAEIERHGQMEKFCKEIVSIARGVGIDAPVLHRLALAVVCLTATPAQLTAALVVMIKVVEDEPKE